MKIDVLNAGYVQYLHHMGDDKEVVNAARASFGKHVDAISERDVGLLNYLIRHNHTSPFRHCAISLAVRAPLFVARQLWKYHVAVTHTEEQDGWNESSRRYVTEEPEFYLPKWRKAPESKKQGSGDFIQDPAAHVLDYDFLDAVQEGLRRYNDAIADGVAPEQARCFLPAYAMYVSWHWTMGMQSMMALLKERMASDAQWETQQYANAMHQIAESVWPVTTRAWLATP